MILEGRIERCGFLGCMNFVSAITRRDSGESGRICFDVFSAADFHDCGRFYKKKLLIGNLFINQYLLNIFPIKPMFEVKRFLQTHVFAVVIFDTHIH